MKIAKSSFLFTFALIFVFLLVSNYVSRKVKKSKTVVAKTSAKAPLLKVPGICIGAKGTLQNTNQPDTFIKKAYDAVRQNVAVVLDNPNVCFGDFSGSHWDEDNDKREQHLEDDLCLTMALEDSPSANYSVFSFNVPKIPCGDTTDATATACFMINDKACIGLAVNTEIAACLLSYIPDPYGITKLIGLLKDIIPEVVFVVCPERGIEEDFEIMLYDSKKKKPAENKVEIRGSIQFSIGLAVPEDWLKLTKIPLIEKIFEVSGICTYIYDFGAKATDFINLLKTTKVSKIEDFANLFNEAIKKLNPSIYFLCDGKAVLGISKLSLQVLPDLEITIAQCELLFNYLPKDNVSTGIHLSCRQDILKDIEAFIKAIFEKFSLDKQVKIPSSKLSLNVSITDKGLLFIIELSPKLHLMCNISHTGKLECNIGGVLFEIIKDGVKFIIKEIDKFMDQAVDKIEDGVEDAVDEMKDLAKKGYDVSKKLVGRIKKVVKEKINKVADEVKDTAKTVEKETKKVVKKLKNVAKKVAKAVKKVAKKVKDKVKKFFSGW